MKILVLNWRDLNHPRAGGAEVRLHEIYRRLVKRGHEVHLISTHFRGAASEENNEGIQIHRQGSDRSFSFLCALNLKSWIKTYEADVVVEDLNKLPLWSPWGCKKPLLIQMHHLWLKSIFKETHLFAAFVVWLSEKMVGLFYKKQKFCVVSPSTQRELHQLGIPSSQIKVIYNGTDLDFYQSNDEKRKAHQVLWLGRMQKYKGPLDAVKAIERSSIAEVKLLMAGEGPFLDEVKAYVKNRKLSDRVEFLGFISKEEKLRLLQRSSLLLQTSYKEGWGLTVTEAGACACPVLAANSPGLVDSVKEGYNGFLYSVGNIDDLSQKMDYLLTNNQILNELSKGGVSWSHQFTWEKAADQTETLLKEIICSHE